MENLIISIPTSFRLGDIVSINHPEATDEKFLVTKFIIECGKIVILQVEITSMLTGLKMVVSPSAIH